MKYSADINVLHFYVQNLVITRICRFDCCSGLFEENRFINEAYV